MNILIPSKNSDINPIGREVEVRYDYEISEINPSITK